MNNHIKCISMIFVNFLRNNLMHFHIGFWGLNKIGVSVYFFVYFQIVVFCCCDIYL